MRISDWSSDVCSSDLTLDLVAEEIEPQRLFLARREKVYDPAAHSELARVGHCFHTHIAVGLQQLGQFIDRNAFAGGRSEEHTSELQSLMRTSYAVFCLTKKHKQKTHNKSLYSINQSRKIHL